MKNINNIDQVEKILNEQDKVIKDKWFFYNFWIKVDIKDNVKDCWNWKCCLTNDNYGLFRHKGKIHRAHRIAYELSKGKIPENKIMMHMCNNPMCCNPLHLKPGTFHENSEYYLRCGRTSQTTLCENDVRNIHELYYKKNKKQCEIAELYKINQGNLSRILNGKRWSYIYQEEG